MLRLDDVSLRRGGRMIFERLSIALEPGGALQVAGPNGSGKSSLIRLIAGLLRQEHGTVERAGFALADDALALDRELPLRRALTFWGGGVDDAMSALAIDNLADVPVRLLSSGQAKRAALARAVASGAPLWLLDEPLNALDDDGTARLEALVNRHRQSGGGIVAASHRPLSGEWRRIELGR